MRSWLYFRHKKKKQANISQPKSPPQLSLSLLLYNFSPALRVFKGERRAERERERLVVMWAPPSEAILLPISVLSVTRAVICLSGARACHYNAPSSGPELFRHAHIHTRCLARASSPKIESLRPSQRRLIALWLPRASSGMRLKLIQLVQTA